VPVVPLEGVPAARGPRSTAKIFTGLTFERSVCVALNVTTTKKRSSRSIFFFWGGEKSEFPEKILAMCMRKGPRLTLGWGPQMVNPALQVL